MGQLQRAPKYKGRRNEHMEVMGEKLTAYLVIAIIILLILA